MAVPGSNYVPGVCNINQAEIAYRRKAGFFGLGLVVLIAVVLFALGANRFARLVLFLPLLIAVAGFLQARHRFCVKYGASGQQNASEGSDKASTVTDAEALQADKRKARAINLQAVAVAAAVTLLTVLV